MKDLLKYSQEGLRDHGYDGDIDGVAGPKTEAALNQVFIVPPDASWGPERKAIAYAQFLLNKENKDSAYTPLKVDGVIGPKTTAVFERLKEK